MFGEIRTLRFRSATVLVWLCRAKVLDSSIDGAVEFRTRWGIHFSSTYLEPGAHAHCHNVAASLRVIEYLDHAASLGVCVSFDGVVKSDHAFMLDERVLAIRPVRKGHPIANAPRKLVTFESQNKFAALMRDSISDVEVETCTLDVFGECTVEDFGMALKSSSSKFALCRSESSFRIVLWG